MSANERRTPHRFATLIRRLSYVLLGTSMAGLLVFSGCDYDEDQGVLTGVSLKRDKCMPGHKKKGQYCEPVDPAPAVMPSFGEPARPFASLVHTQGRGGGNFPTDDPGCHGCGDDHLLVEGTSLVGHPPSRGRHGWGEAELDVRLHRVHGDEPYPRTSW